MLKEALALKSLDLILDIIEQKTRQVNQIDTDDLKKEITQTLEHSPALIERIKQAEGFSPHAYQCTAGVDTIGYGRNISKSGGITKEEADYLLANDLETITRTLPGRIQCFQELSEDRKEILIEMAFQLGTGGLMKFKKFLSNLEAGNFEEASKEMLNSRWAQQTPQRAQRLAKAMLLGKA